MKRTNILIIGLSLLGVALIVALAVYFNDIQQTQEAQLKIETNRSDVLALKLHERDSIVNEYVTTFNLIEKDLSYIKEQENILDAKSKNPEFTKDKKQAIIDDIKLVNSLLDQNKQRIAELNKKLKNSGIEIAGLNEKITMLSEAINQRDISMEGLKDELAQKDIQLSQLNQRVGQMDSVVTVQTNVINSKQAELNKGYIAYGNYKDLKEKGIVTKEGGILTIGSNVTLSDNLDQQNFEKIDITQTTTIPVHSKKAKLITTHPEGSYEWVEDNGQIAYMVIDHPEEFWKVSKYAVVETK